MGQTSTEQCGWENLPTSYWGPQGLEAGREAGGGGAQGAAGRQGLGRGVWAREEGLASSLLRTGPR